MLVMIPAHKIGMTVVMAVALAVCTSSMVSHPPRSTPATEVIHLESETGVPVTPTAVTAAAGYVWVLGTYSCEAGTCPVLMRSTDGGTTWEGVGTPPYSVDAIDFATGRTAMRTSEGPMTRKPRSTGRGTGERPGISFRSGSHNRALRQSSSRAGAPTYSCPRTAWQTGSAGPKT